MEENKGENKGSKRDKGVIMKIKKRNIERVKEKQI